MISKMSKDVIDRLQLDWGQERPDLDAEPMGVVLRIQALAKILADRTAASLREFDLQWWQYDVLSTLRRQGAPFVMAATELADTNMLTSGAMTNRIDGLEAKGLVRRLKDDNDRRRVLVQLTKEGLDLIEDATEVRFEAATDALDGLDPAQKKQLSDLLRTVLNAQGV
jgi:DNA-binding MarR family transcriptional regulator